MQEGLRAVPGSVILEISNTPDTTVFFYPFR
jgi:hypothetical protein